MKTLYLLSLALLLGATSLLAFSLGAHSTKPNTNLIVTDNGSALVVLIKDQEVARFTKDGLTISGNIAYSGALRDTQSPDPQDNTSAPKPKLLGPPLEAPE